MTRQKSAYPSNVMGEFIVNAVTGAKYPWQVGSFDDQRFFKVVDTANNVSFKSPDYEKKISNKLFYESPFEYMSHKHIKLDNSVIEKWRNRLNKHFPDNPYMHGSIGSNLEDQNPDKDIDHDYEDNESYCSDS